MCFSYAHPDKVKLQVLGTSPKFSADHLWEGTFSFYLSISFYITTTTKTLSSKAMYYILKNLLYRNQIKH